ncbi:ABC transporter family substrate-binding protein [Actinocorallia populi]|uniref:ABC transporter family substrate-binding protein n=1 Tax=Actinocorallia populi TaxID=2079200 RepID=UPI000D092C28|nr:ABC transporter family substrate-binding protein [Actinocorallia populi]
MRTHAWKAVLAVFPLAAGACAAPQPRIPSGPPALADLRLTPREHVRDGGVLRWPLPSFPGQWNFNQVNGMDGVSELVLRGLMPFTMVSDERGEVRPHPDYLLSARVLEGPGQVVRYRVNPRARWSDGRPLGYRDFAAQARALSGRDGRFRAATDTGYRQIASVRRGRSDTEVLVAFREPFADWKALFSPLYPAETNSDPESFNEGWRGRIPVTAGPFKVGALDEAGQTVTLVRDPAWWGGQAKLDEIRFRALAPAARAGAFANRELDLLEAGDDPGAYRRGAALPWAEVRRAAGPDWRHLTLNARRGPLADPSVRRALLLALDRGLLARAALEQLDSPVETLGSHFLTLGRSGYRDLAPAPDLGSARALLAGAEPALEYVVPAGNPAHREEAELVQAMLARAGFRVSLRSVPQNELISGHVLRGDFDLVSFSWLGTPFPVADMASVFVRGGGQNFTGAGSARLDGLLARAARELDAERGAVLVGRADELLWEQAAVIPLYQRPQLVVLDRDLVNVGARGLRHLRYEDIGRYGRGSG